jgi:hypothetical protein
MDNEWSELTPDEKRVERFKKWLSPPDVEFPSLKVENAYRTRVTRFIKAIQLKKPDRVPVLLPAGFLPAFYNGGTLHSVMYDYDELSRAWQRYIRDFDMDMFSGPGLVYPGKVMDDIDFKMHKWPGHGIPFDSSSYQYVEGEYMSPDEYDEFMQNPSDFWWRAFLPRTCGAFEAFKYLPAFTGMMLMPLGHIIACGRPEVRAAFQTFLDAGQEALKWQGAVQECNKAALAAGIPSMRSGGFTGAPFDMIGDVLRGTQGVIMDMYRRPEKLIEAMEKITPIAVRTTVNGNNAVGGLFASMPLHKGEDSFMSLKQFEKFYWPTLKKVCLGLINEGIIPYLFAEGRYESRLEIISELPAGSVIWHFENTDMGVAKKVLGDKACIAGNVPASVLCTGTPQEVKECCRKIIEEAGEGGGLILTGAASMNKGNPDNLRAMMEAVEEYSVYK